MKTLFFFLLFVTQTFAGASQKEVIVYATDQGGHPAPALCFFSNNYMIPHPQGLLVLYTCFGGPDINSELWLIKETPEFIVRSKMGNLLTHPYVRGEDIYVLEFSEFATEALWKKSAAGLSRIELPETLAHSHVHDFSLAGDTFYFRYTQVQTREHGEGTFTDHFAFLPDRGVEYFYKATGNGEIMLQKLKFPEGEALELRRADGTTTTVLKDHKLDPASPFTTLRSQFGLHRDQWVSFANTEKGLCLIRGKGTTYQSEDVSALIKEAQYWPPALSADGEVIFRGTDFNRTFALWGYKDGKLRQILGSDEEIGTGSDRVITSRTSLLYNSPVFDESGKLYIGVGLRNPGESKDFGQGVLVIK